MSYSKTLYKITDSNTPFLNLLKGCIQIFLILKKTFNKFFICSPPPAPAPAPAPKGGEYPTGKNVKHIQNIL